MKYDVETDFYPLTTCNFRCSYCFLSPAALGAPIRRHGTADQWEEGFNATGKIWLIHITGGEPFVYPGFVELCQKLSRRHSLSLNSNLAHPSADEFVEKVDPGRVHYINAAVHFDERHRRAGLGVFIGRVRKFQDAKFNVLLSLVMTPEMVAAYPGVSTFFGTHGLALVPKVLRGLYQGARYPEAYTADQRARIQAYLLEARSRYAEVLARMAEPPTIDLFSDGRFLRPGPGYRGKVCGSGYNFVVIHPNGAVVRCGSGELLGNVLQKTVRLLNSPKPCDTAYCPYFCEKYTSPRFAHGREDRREVPQSVTLPDLAEVEAIRQPRQPTDYGGPNPEAPKP
jgi:MoaA/NifB/PqqE/SkfB family radical SAM enzyme